MKRFFFLFLIILVFVLDRALKILISNQTEQVFFLIPRIFGFSFFKNYFLAFSMPFAGRTIILTISALIIMAIIVLSAKKIKQKKYFSFCAGLSIILGALSNFFDRAASGYVIDYFFLAPISRFNLADLLIGAGIILLIKEEYVNQNTSRGLKRP